MFVIPANSIGMIFQWKLQNSRYFLHLLYFFVSLSELSIQLSYYVSRSVMLIRCTCHPLTVLQRLQSCDAILCTLINVRLAIEWCSQPIPLQFMHNYS